MAKPYSDGTTSSPIFGSKDCKVLSEKMDLTIVTSEMYDDYSEFYRVKYKVSYQIYSEKKLNSLYSLLHKTWLPKARYLLTEKVKYSENH